MSTVSNPKEPGQEENPIVELLDKHTRAIVKMTSAMTKLSSRLNVLEASDRQARRARGEEPSTRPEPPGPPVAFLNDGRVALSYRYFDGHDIKLDETWEGVILPVAESSDFMDATGEAMESIASAVAHEYIERELKKEFNPTEPEDEDEDPDTERGGEES